MCGPSWRDVSEKCSKKDSLVARLCLASLLRDEMLPSSEVRMHTRGCLSLCMFCLIGVAFCPSCCSCLLNDWRVHAAWPFPSTHTHVYIFIYNTYTHTLTHSHTLTHTHTHTHTLSLLPVQNMHTYAHCTVPDLLHLCVSHEPPLVHLWHCLESALMDNDIPSPTYNTTGPDRFSVSLHSVLHELQRWRPSS